MKLLNNLFKKSKPEQSTENREWKAPSWGDLPKFSDYYADEKKQNTLAYIKQLKVEQKILAEYIKTHKKCETFLASFIFRHRHIAYCLLRDKKYQEIEQTTRKDNKPKIEWIVNLTDPEGDHAYSYGVDKFVEEMFKKYDNINDPENSMKCMKMIEKYNKGNKNES